MQLNRDAGRAAVAASAVLAGTIESRSGRNTDAPIPRNTVLRDRCRFVLNMGPTSLNLNLVMCPCLIHVRLRNIHRCQYAARDRGFRASHQEWLAVDDAEDERRKR